MARPRAHYALILEPPDPDTHHFWPSVDFDFEGLEFYPDEWVRLRVSAPMTWRASDVLEAFSDWGVGSIDLLDGGMHFPVGSVWNNYQHKSRLLDEMLTSFQHSCDLYRLYGIGPVDK